MRTLRWVLIGIAVLLLAVAGGVTWLLNSQAGARWSAGVATDFLRGKLSIDSVQGTLAGPLQVHGVRYRDAQSGVDAHVDTASVDVALSELLRWRLHIESASASGVDARLSEPTKKKEPKPFSLEPPIDLVLDHFALDHLQVARNGESLLVVRRAEASGRWLDSGIAIRKLTVDSPQGSVQLNGELADNEGYIGKLAGQFNWRAGDRTYAGQLQANGAQRQANITLKLSAPLAAQLNATLQQQQNLPWRLDLRVPSFDPRKQLLPNGSLESLAANLQGAGNRSLAEIRGTVTLNGQTLRIEPLRARLQNQAVKLEALTLIDPRGKGSLNAQGEVRFDAKPFFADLALQWRDVSLPKEWVGQELATRGDIRARGNLATFDANGDFLLGPPRRLANVTFAIDGTPQQIELKRLAIVEDAPSPAKRGRVGVGASGTLTAEGRVQLKPVVGWQIKAQAKSFDPGAFIAGWPGRLDLTLASNGQLLAAGPQASLDLSRLEGTLRKRPLSGRASLTLNPNKVVAGNLRVRSGGSVVRLTGARGESFNVTADFDVTALDDWLPDAGGQLNGRFRITGRWPELTIDGAAHGNKLVLAQSSAEAINVQVNVKNPLHPRGKVEADAKALHAGGFEFASIGFTASGNERQHTAALVATGEPLSGELRVSGARQGKGWTGTLEQLKLSATDIAQLALREPARLSVSPDGLSISNSCLTGDAISVCVAADRDETGALHASYSLEHLPLALLAALAKPDLGFQLSGTLEGQGKIQRAPNRAFSGEAHLSSASGGARELGAEGAELLSYQNFKADAALTGDSAQLSTSASLNQGSPLKGEATLTGLRGGAPQIKGEGSIDLKDLAPLGLFTPQLADVKGRAEARVAIAGALSAPQITGSMHVLEFAAEVPVVGLKLKDGEFELSTQNSGHLKLAGHVTSGDGKLNVEGGGASLDDLKLKATGENFLAANIPAARVVITPDLELTRGAKRMDLSGTVNVPHAAIDVTKLPQGGGQRASADVVVIDDEAIEQSRSVPLYANITVILGKDVKLAGFGLDATLAGQLNVRETPGEPTLGSGEIKVTGTYKAYGQDLTIQQGSLLFAASPLNNPQVNLIAVRTLPDVTAKLTVTGSAQRPLLSVSSDQPMSQTEALSYLVTGKPLNTLGTGEGDVVQSAARSLGGAAGNLLAKNIGKRIGVDEIGIQNNTDIGGSAFTVGQYLSPRLYLSYGVGLFEPGQVVTLRYRISNHLSLDASQGSLNQRAGVTYKIEK